MIQGRMNKTILIASLGVLVVLQARVPGPPGSLVATPRPGATPAHRRGHGRRPAVVGLGA